MKKSVVTIIFLSVMVLIGEVGFVAAQGQYPSLLASVGARHADFTYEWLGDQVDNESDSKQIDKDLSDDGVAIRLLTPSEEELFGPSPPLSFAMDLYVNNSGAPNRYNPANPKERLYLNAWMDWNGNGSWADTKDKIIGTGSDNTKCTKIFGRDTVAVDPAPNTPGITKITCRITIPDTFFPDGETGSTTADFFYLRVRLDYGEDVGKVDQNPDQEGIQKKSDDLDEFKGLAQNGEVEDHAVLRRLPLQLRPPSGGGGCTLC